MANTLTNLSYTSLAQRAIDAFVRVIQPLTTFSTNFMQEGAIQGEEVKVLTIPTAASALSFSTEYTIQDSTATGVDIALNQRRYVSWNLTTQQIANNPQLNLERFAMQKGNQLAIAVVQNIWSTITAANFGDNAGDKLTSTAANFDTDDVIDIAQKCDSKNWPQENRMLFLNPIYYNALLKDVNIKASYAFGSQGPQESGEIMRNLFGFDLYMSNIIPGNSENLVGFAIHPQAISVASRVLVPDDPANVLDFEVITDDELGVALGMKAWHVPSTDQTNRVLEFSYGHSVTDSNAVVRVLSA